MTCVRADGSTHTSHGQVYPHLAGNPQRPLPRDSLFCRAICFFFVLRLGVFLKSFHGTYPLGAFQDYLVVSNHRGPFSGSTGCRFCSFSEEKKQLERMVLQALKSFQVDQFFLFFYRGYCGF